MYTLLLLASSAHNIPKTDTRPDVVPSKNMAAVLGKGANGRDCPEVNKGLDRNLGRNKNNVMNDGDGEQSSNSNA